MFVHDSGAVLVQWCFRMLTGKWGEELGVCERDTWEFSWNLLNALSLAFGIFFLFDTCV